jgi:hypothetical protein
LVARRSYRPIEVPIELVLDDAAARTVDRVLGGFPASAPASDRASFGLTRAVGGDWLVLRSDEIVARGHSLDAAVDSLVTVVNGEVIGAFEGFAVHAGVIAGADGAIAFPGASGMGKSTLTAACLQVGSRYVSDEALCVAFDAGLVLPYAKPISLSPSSQRLLGLSPRDSDVLVTPEELGAGTVRAPLPLSHLVRLARTGGPPRLIPLPRSAGLADLLRFSFNHYKWREAAVELAGRLAAGARTWRLEYSSPGAAAELLFVLAEAEAA